MMPTTATTVTINGKPYSWDQAPPSVSLNEFIRNGANLKGTKYCCYEGGCGSCTVVVSYTDALGRTVHRSVPSCLTPLALCDGMHVTTIEGLGGKNSGGYHPLQERLADNSGTQCGYCSPGFVMAMYDLLLNNPNPQAQEVEAQLDGNICRCTGYRPILDTMKSFCPDWPQQKQIAAAASKFPPERRGIADIEELKSPCGGCDGSNGGKCGNAAMCFGGGACGTKTPSVVTKASAPRSFVSAGVPWMDVYSEIQLQATLMQFGSGAMLVSGHTSLAVERNLPPQAAYTAFINVRPIPSFTDQTFDTSGVRIGACVSITDLIGLLQQAYDALSPKPHTFPTLIAMLNRVASHNIRNAASAVGNLVLCHRHQKGADSFPSDLTVALLGIGARVELVDVQNVHTEMALESFFGIALDGTRYVRSVFIPYPATQYDQYQCYKTAHRPRFSHTYVSAAFRCTVDPTTRHVVPGSAALFFVGVRGAPFRAAATELIVNNMVVTDPVAFQTACATLKSELAVDPALGSTDFRTSLALSYFYKFILLLQPALSPPLQLAAQPWLTRGASRATQAFQPHPAEYPVGKWMPKLAAKEQTSGEAVYVNDIPAPSTTLHGAFVLSTMANATVTAIDTTAALAMPGVVAVYSAKDIDPDRNLWLNLDIQRPLFATNVAYAGQPIALVIAQSSGDAIAATYAVRATYQTNGQTVITSLDQAIAANSFWTDAEKNIPSLGDQAAADAALKVAPKVVSGTVRFGGQRHMHLENQTVLVLPEDGGLQVHAATQFPSMVQAVVAQVTGLRQSNVTVTTRRCGGGYGGKILNSCLAPAGAAFVASKLNVPVSIVTPLQTTLTALGGRPATRADYQVGFDTSGRISVVKMQCFIDSGSAWGDAMGEGQVLLQNIDNVYSIPNWYATCRLAKTNTAPNTSVRGPGWTQATYLMEHVVNRVADALDLPADSIRPLNFYTKGQTSPSGDIVKYFSMPAIWSQVQTSSSFQSRQATVRQFNAANRWRKRGLSLVPVKFGVGWIGSQFHTLLVVSADGSVSVTTGGIEIGQGLHTKVAQVVAQQLQTDISNISIQPTTTKIGLGPNEATGGSITSELCSWSALNACQTLLQRLAPVRQMLGPQAPFAAVAAKAASMNIDLSAKSDPPPPPDGCGTQSYNSYSAAAVEVEVDLLTGEHQILRTDFLFDCGISLNPAIDIGQIEGAFMMGVGLYTTENVTFDPTTGYPDQHNTWEYKPPLARDVPLEWHITLLRDAPNPVGVLSSKAVGEPPLLSACGVVFAIEQAVRASLEERGLVKPGEQFSIDAPANVLSISAAARISSSEFSLQ
eukprot:TRINITY_DN9970_c0_g1_i1.p1 TRINITY_DN9970_c0_g1~~TRINITY_DN9970_c0_g1_i1.p1  ORF type:complete len:1321 (-),score=227.62 TRINITY_DN9970_c0_g1_i1:116-4078(-)